MALQVLCDGGCGAHATKPENWKEFGQIIKRHYCPECAEKVQVMDKKIDDLHDDLAKRWKDGLNEIRDEFRKDNPQAELPDV